MRVDAIVGFSFTGQGVKLQGKQGVSSHIRKAFFKLHTPHVHTALDFRHKHYICSNATGPHFVQTICIVCLQICAQKLVLISIYVHLTIGPILMCAWQLGTVVRSIYSKQRNGSSNLKTFFWTQRKCFAAKSICKFAVWFSSVFQLLQMHCCVFCNLADSSSIKPNQEIIWSIHGWKSYTHVAIQVQVFWRKPKKQRLFSLNKKLKALTEKKKHFYVINWICDKILSENMFRNINKRN